MDKNTPHRCQALPSPLADKRIFSCWQDANGNLVLDIDYEKYWCIVRYCPFCGYTNQPGTNQEELNADGTVKTWERKINENPKLREAFLKLGDQIKDKSDQA